MNAQFYVVGRYRGNEMSYVQRVKETNVGITWLVDHILSPNDLLQVPRDCE